MASTGARKITAEIGNAALAVTVDVRETLVGGEDERAIGGREHDERPLGAG